MSETGENLHPIETPLPKKSLFERGFSKLREHLNPPVNPLREATAEEKQHLTDLIGGKVPSLLDERGLTLSCFNTASGALSYAIEYKERVLIINQIFGKPDQTKKGNNQEKLKGILVHFLMKDDFEPGAKRTPFPKKRKKNEVFKKVDEKLLPGTGDFLRFTGEVVLAVDEETDVVLEPSTSRRERLFRRFFKKYNRRNIRIRPANDYDIKGKKPIRP